MVLIEQLVSHFLSSPMSWINNEFHYRILSFTFSDALHHTSQTTEGRGGGGRHRLSDPHEKVWDFQHNDNLEPLISASFFACKCISWCCSFYNYLYLKSFYMGQFQVRKWARDLPKLSSSTVNLCNNQNINPKALQWQNSVSRRDGSCKYGGQAL